MQSVQTKLTKVQAARAAGVSHTTIWRMVKAGRLSAEKVGNDVRIDASELIRVFPDADLTRTDVHAANRSAHVRTHARELHVQDEGLRELVEELKADKRRQAEELAHAARERAEFLAMLRQKDEVIAEKDRQLAEQMQTVKLLTDQRSRPRRWWHRWRKAE